MEEKAQIHNLVEKYILNTNTKSDKNVFPLSEKTYDSNEINAMID